MFQGLSTANGKSHGTARNTINPLQKQAFRAGQKKGAPGNLTVSEKPSKTLEKAWFPVTCLWCEEDSPRSASSTQPLHPT